MNRTACFVTVLAAGWISLTGPATAVGLASLHKQQRVGAKVCFTSHYHHIESGGFASEQAARSYAIKRWQDFTRNEYGPAWASYKLASAPSLDCTKSIAGGGSVVNCKIKAKPCRKG